jgi:hypothetical protein
MNPGMALFLIGMLIAVALAVALPVVAQRMRRGPGEDY